MKDASISKVIGSILEKGASQCQIQRETGIPQPRLNRWFHKGSQAADDAIKLIALAKKYERKKPKARAGGAA